METRSWFLQVSRHDDEESAMIVVCEPQCKGISHEEVNSGFIYGLRLTYPKERIVLFSEASHFRNIKDIFKENKIKVGNVQHCPINFDANRIFSMWGIIGYYFLFQKIFNNLPSFGANKLFCLSTNPIILYVIKQLKSQDRYKDINCTFVLHGEMEDIANKKYIEPYTPIIKGYSPKLTKLIKTFLDHPDRAVVLIIKIIFWPFIALSSHLSTIIKNKFRTKDMMMWKHSNQYKYIALSPHIVINTKKYIDVNLLNIHTVTMPIIFNKPYGQTDNKYIRFAVFGYGDSAQMHKMLLLLSKKHIKNTYEIKIISMDDRGTDGFKNITHVGNGNMLTRKEMENAAKDVDVFINLYDKSRHRFGCSLSIFEALSYLKPVLHLSNDGYNYFNKLKKPIGYRCENLNEFVKKFIDMVENYPRYKNKLATFRRNMIVYRKEYNIENNLLRLKRSFTF